MKGFVREDLRFSLCGLNCLLCPMNLGGYCPGCGGGAGNQGCAHARCSVKKGGLSYCWQCGDYPCALYEGAEAYDSFISHARQLTDTGRFMEIGAAAYHDELTRRRAVLDGLLARHNDGRRKTLFLQAANLLPLKTLEDIIKRLDANGAGGPPAAQTAADLLLSAAGALGISLKLRKKGG